MSPAALQVTIPIISWGGDWIQPASRRCPQAEEQHPINFSPCWGGLVFVVIQVKQFQACLSDESFSDDAVRLFSLHKVGDRLTPPRAGGSRRHDGLHTMSASHLLISKYQPSLKRTRVLGETAESNTGTIQRRDILLQQKVWKWSKARIGQMKGRWGRCLQIWGILNIRTYKNVH